MGIKKIKPISKKCSICKQLKNLIEFSPCKTGSLGVYAYCNHCRSALLKQNNPNRIAIDENNARRIGLRKLGLKTCTSCKTIKYLDEFYKDPRKVDGKQQHCKECFLQRSNRHYLKKEYGITPEEYSKMLNSQNGVCAICERPPKKYKFNIDHSHKTHKIRALLCVNCNTNLLPIVERFPEWVKKAFIYLENPPAFLVIGEREVPLTNQSRKKLKQNRK